MSWLFILLAAFAGLHLGLLMPTQIAIIGSAVFTIILWVLWKLKWVILGIIGLEEIFGGKNDNNQDT
jgi:hypothetical protein